MWWESGHIVVSSLTPSRERSIVPTKPFQHILNTELCAYLLTGLQGDTEQDPGKSCYSARSPGRHNKWQCVWSPYKKSLLDSYLSEKVLYKNSVHLILFHFILFYVSGGRDTVIVPESNKRALADGSLLPYICGSGHLAMWTFSRPHWLLYWTLIAQKNIPK